MWCGKHWVMVMVDGHGYSDCLIFVLYVTNYVCIIVI